MSLTHLRLRDAARVVAVLALAASAAGCEKDNPNFCASDDPRPECNVDAAIDAPPSGCMENPGICSVRQDCFQDTCVDCADGGDHQTEQCEDAAEPVCDATRACRPCELDSECDSNFCDHGTCVPASQVLFVKHDGNDAGGDNPCTDIAAPCATVTQALRETPTTGGNPAMNTRFIRLLTVGTYTEPGMVVIDNRTVVIVGAPPVGGDRSVIDRMTMGQTMEVKGQSVVRLERLAVNDANGNAAKGIECKESATLVADGIEVANNTGVGVVGDACTLTLRNSLVTRSAGGGASVQNGRAVVVNNVIVDNGGTASDFGALLISASVLTTSVIESNTVLSNESAAGQPDGIDCRIALTTRNNIVTGDATKARVAGACTHVHALFSPDDPGNRLTGGTGNLLIPNVADLQFVDPAMKDYHIRTTSFAKGKGTVTGLAAEAMKDMDGQPRPQGTPDVGADEIPD